MVLDLAAAVHVRTATDLASLSVVTEPDAEESLIPIHPSAVAPPAEARADIEKCGTNCTENVVNFDVVKIRTVRKMVFTMLLGIWYKIRQKK